jgi:hypothetical protein
LSGPTYVTSGQSDIIDKCRAVTPACIAAAVPSGHLEYTPLFFAGAKGVPMVEQWPVVKGGAMKLWFVQDEEEKEEEAVYSATQS